MQGSLSSSRRLCCVAPRHESNEHSGLVELPSAPAHCHPCKLLEVSRRGYVRTYRRRNHSEMEEALKRQRQFEEDHDLALAIERSEIDEEASSSWPICLYRNLDRILIFICTLRSFQSLRSSITPSESIIAVTHVCDSDRFDAVGLILQECPCRRRPSAGYWTGFARRKCIMTGYSDEPVPWCRDKPVCLRRQKPSQPKA